MNGDIEIEIGAGSEIGQYAVRVLRAAAGGEPVGTLELDVEEILRRRELLESTVLASAVARRSVPVAEQPVRDVGLQLFRALFTGPAYGMYRASMGVAQQRGNRLRVVLRLTAPELAALPWEMLFDPETATYLCRQEPLVRHVDAPYTADPLAVDPPLRILGVVASPRGLPVLDVETEKRHLAEALAGPIAAGLIELVWAPEATWQGIHAQLLSGQWHVLHFVGHGDYDTSTDEGVLALVGGDGRADLVEADRLADLLGEAQPTPRLVVLNSCSSGRTGVTALFSGTAAVLARRGISAVAAMQFTISDTAAIAFARGFYTAIANGRNIDEAARSGRISILGAPGSLEWVTPVLYVRGQASQLFSFKGPPRTGRKASENRESLSDQSPVRPQVTEPDRRRKAELRALYVEARAELRLEHFSTAIGLFDDLLTLDPGYADATELRDKAQRGQQLADAYASAVAAEDTGDWAAAARWYGEVLRVDPAYRDAADRKDACEKRQQVADLEAELRHHASAGQWQAVLDVGAELARLDPSSSDPDGLISHARGTLAAAAHAADVERRYAQACAAEDSQQWSAAMDGYSEILDMVPGYRDAEARRDRCRQRSRVAGLESELTKQVTAEDWPRVLATFRELAAFDPAAAAKPSWTEAADRAQRELASHPGELLLQIKSYWPARAVGWRPDGGRVAVALANYVYIYDVLGREPKEQVKVKTGGITVGVRSVAFSPDGTRLATGGGARWARIWDATSAQELLEVRHGLTTTVRSVAFSPDGTRLATASDDKSARIWDAAGGDQLLDVRHDKAVRSVAFSPDGLRLATGSDDNSARIWDAAGGHQLFEGSLGGSVASVAFSPDSTRLAAGSLNHIARVWDAASGRQLFDVRHDGVVNAVAFSPDGTRLATGSGDNSARIWDAASGRKLVEVRHGKPVNAVAFSPDGTRLATGSDDNSVKIWALR